VRDKRYTASFDPSPEPNRLRGTWLKSWVPAIWRATIVQYPSYQITSSSRRF
jgi:hypothetical protein